MTSSSVFALGWQAMINIKQATFWKQNQDDQTIAKKKRPYDKTNRSANALYLREKSGVYKKNGSDPSRINSLIQKDSCLCASKTCFKQFAQSKELHQFIGEFWDLNKQDQDSLLQTSSTGSGPTQAWTLLGHPIGFKCLASLVAVGKSRLRNASAHAAPDLRHGKKAHRSKPGTWTADAFFQVAYDSIAETLPDQFVRRGRAKKRSRRR
ncbi:unnamed protein product [Durusdinium trenchii]|uniref:Uncharacterized protein n=1 Tax=Durusdinium trenchii TaxID=1381693 RepID=A0ABP0KVY5_9DINO